jgi:hypothetical protein
MDTLIDLIQLLTQLEQDKEAFNFFLKSTDQEEVFEQAILDLAILNSEFLKFKKEVLNGTGDKDNG